VSNIDPNLLVQAFQRSLLTVLAFIAVVELEAIRTHLKRIARNR
jgi:hypothetical protein